MMHVLRGLGRHKDMVTMFEEAFKQQPLNEELGAQTFFANVRAGQWKSAQQIATKMHKQFKDDRYIYWSIISAILQADDITTPESMRPILYKLAHRMLSSSSTPPHLSADRFYLHLSVLQKLDLLDEAHKLLDSEVGKSICDTNLSCDELRRAIWRSRGMIQEEAAIAEMRIVDKKSRNWLEFLSILEATFCYLTAGTEPPSAEAEGKCREHMLKTRVLFTQLVEEDGPKDRSATLALLELECRARHHGLSEPSRLVEQMKAYFEKFGDKACCFEDLKPYLVLESEELSSWTTFLDSHVSSFETLNELWRVINAVKLLRYSLSEAELSVEAESQRVTLYLKHYLEGLKLGVDLATTELQPADDLVLLAGNALINLWKLTADDAHLFDAAAVLEFALTKSKHSFQARLLLVRIYRLLGAPSLALEHYRNLQIKQIQNDTLSHFALSRASTFSLASTGDLTWASECLEATQIYLSNSQDTGDFVVRAFTAEKYSQIPEFIGFEDRLDNSLQRDLMKMEHLRMRLTHEQITSDIIDMELIELKFVFDRVHYDNRDHSILSNYQPRIIPGIDKQTQLFDGPEKLGWLRSFLKLYVRALQQGSDLDDTVEEKLLIGDRPKQNVNQRDKPSLKERLAEKDEEELSELTADERDFAAFAYALATWLGPYHDYIRPPAVVVLAEAAKQTEQKTGHPLKGVDLQALNGAATNGKKDEECPPPTDAPDIVHGHFDKLGKRFLDVRASASPVPALHVATLAQEALLLFAIETLRFKSPSVVKMHKLGALASSFKTLRADAVAVLQDISADLLKLGEAQGSADSRKTLVEKSNISAEIDQDFLVGVAKRVTEARKKALDGVGKGLSRICSAYCQ
uniref:Alpha-actin cytoskeleton organization protein n=1 Tax=Macrocybe gigantea TaxID=1491104 RepID=A0A2K8JR03_MACGN|nr:alpha-actin cytoskeleton organization protein [Macrocybe gigantea]